MVTKRSLLVLIGKGVFGFAYLLAAGEVFLRLFAPQPMLPRYVCPTSYGIRGNTPSLTYRHRAPEYSIEIHTNSKGLRSDREIPYEKPPGVRRVLLLGDSFGIGYGVSLEDMFLSRMVASLTAAGVPCEPVNLSVSGFGTAEELVALQEEGFRYQPDLVVVAWHLTDPEDNIRANLYALEDGRLVCRNATYLPAVKTRQWFFRLPGPRWLAVHSHLYCCLREKAAVIVKFKILPVMRRLTQPPRSDSVTGPSQPPWPADYPQQLSVALLDEIRRQCERHGASLLILDIPGQRSRTEFYSTFPVRQAQAVAPFHLYSPMADFKAYYGQKLYWEKAHGHFTPLGCRIVGEGLARTALEMQLLPRPRTASGGNAVAEENE
jgi:hypothetical protein